MVAACAPRAARSPSFSILTSGLAVAEGEMGRMRMTFTKLDASAPSREFSFALGVSRTNEFNVVDCKPAVPELAELQAGLKATRNLSAFTVGMRKAFKNIIGAEKEQA